MTQETYERAFAIIKQKMEAVTEVAISQLTSGAQAPKRARRTVTKEKRITELKRRFDENLISLAEYIRGLSGTY